MTGLCSSDCDLSIVVNCLILLAGVAAELYMVMIRRDTVFHRGGTKQATSFSLTFLLLVQLQVMCFQSHTGRMKWSYSQKGVIYCG